MKYFGKGNAGTRCCLEPGSDTCGVCKLFNRPCTATRILHDLEETDRRYAVGPADFNDNVETLEGNIDLTWYNEYEDDEEEEVQEVEPDEEGSGEDAGHGEDDDVEMEDD